MVDVVGVLLVIAIVCGLAMSSALVLIPLALGIVAIGFSVDAALGCALFIVGLLATTVLWMIRDALRRPPC